MALKELEQFQKVLGDSKYILMVFNSKNNGDAVGSALALKTFFEGQGKLVDMAASEFIAPKNLRFLTGVDSIKPKLANVQKFIIKVDVSKAPIETISYDVKDGWLSIYLTPQHGLITKNELRTAQTTFKYDLIITLNTPDLESLGDIFFNNTDLFYKTTIVNIDHEPNNERYGKINITDLNATTTAEIVYGILKHINEHAIDGGVANALLTAITLATSRFTAPHLTPLTLKIASQLIERGADREKIAQNLYRTRSIATLKLWGQALSHLENDPKYGLVWTIITREDFARSGGNAEDLRGIVDELISDSPEAKIILLLYELEENKIGGIVATEKNHDALHLVKPLNPAGNKKQASFTIIGKTLKETEAEVLEMIRGAIQQ